MRRSCSAQAQIKPCMAWKRRETMSESDRPHARAFSSRGRRSIVSASALDTEDLNCAASVASDLSSAGETRVIKQIAEAEKYDLILQEAVYRSPRLDITERVLKALAAER